VADRVELSFARSAIRVTEPSVPAKLGEVRRDRCAALRIGRANEDVGKSIRAFGVHRFGPFIYGPRRVQRRGSFAIRDSKQTILPRFPWFGNGREISSSRVTAPGAHCFSVASASPSPSIARCAQLNMMGYSSHGRHRPSKIAISGAAWSIGHPAHRNSTESRAASAATSSPRSSSMVIVG
jgi:hypothetical protein